MKPVIEFSSPNSKDTLYVCGNCRVITLGGFNELTARETAEKCCLCPTCGWAAKKPGWTMCVGCLKDDRAAKDLARLTKLRALPVVETDGPVYIERLQRYCADTGDAIDTLWYDDEEEDEADLSDELVFPCHVTQCDVPDLVSYVTESWSENFDDGEGETDLPSDLEAALDAIQKRLTKVAPTVWTPDYSGRVLLGPGRDENLDA